ncbi:MAG: GH3 auxin-responsive promoter family protein, partial [Phycisphaerae bacterium]|nr:GH3 auxin-responsive promoter family protein [Phycisphaerae bacterium]
PDGFAMLAPAELEGAKAGYVLHLPADRPADGNLAQRLEELLCENYHYRNCRYLGQLQPVTLATIAQNSPQAFATYQRRMTDAGMRPGEIKFSPLSKLGDW